MTMTLNLEVAQGVRLEDIKDSLAGVEFSNLSEVEDGFSVVLPNTHVLMSVKTNLEDSNVLTEDLEGGGWSVGLRAYFDVDPTLPNPFDDVKKIIRNLEEQTSFEFVLSFQYESLYAHRGLNGLELSDDF
ncbi:hypothetical protein [Amphritea pacifica]|uniref:Uncharacterized protein n=1 Tax=Amphritea pacifica TaxID=2811233 RepID=A0ABS2WDP8_9GAMM|nr:hypothetical protein [Amphritea pacifica]MBN0989741.1 hypothetical protein [Amphritea pacifica]MBN1007410.1 hypothetical protein [Amphritea pacifica]